MPWISKKAKAQMRARRKKKDKAKTNKNNNTSQSDRNNEADESQHVDIGGRQEKHEYCEEDDNNGLITVTISSSLSSKEAKKLRKEARRKARKEQRDESKIKFVDEDGKLLSAENDNDSGISNNNDDGELKSEETKKRGLENIDADTDNNTNPEGSNSIVNRSKKKPKTSFPNINQILAQAKQIKQQKEEEEKRQQYQDSIPDDIKNKYVALDCEMVGIGAEGKQSALARVSITNWNGDIILDTFVQVPDRVTDFRTFVSGVRAKDIRMTNSNSMELHACRQKVGEIIHNKILVGHSLRNDFQALMMNHPRHLIRDTARYKPFMRASGRTGGKMRPRKLRDLVKEHVGLTIQKDGEAHSSVDDAKATMELYKVAHEEWEREVEMAENRKNSIGKKMKKR